MGQERFDSSSEFDHLTAAFFHTESRHPVFECLGEIDNPRHLESSSVAGTGGNVIPQAADPLFPNPCFMSLKIKDLTTHANDLCTYNFVTSLKRRVSGYV